MKSREFVGLVCALVVGCGSDVMEGLPLSSGPEVATFTAPTIIKQSDTVSFSVSFADRGPVDVDIRVGDDAYAPDFTSSGGYWNATVNAPGPFSLGDLALSVKGTTGERPVIGSWIIQVSNQASGAGCGDDETYLNGTCVGSSAGHALTLDRFMLWGEIEFDRFGSPQSVRDMAHPQQQVRVGDRLVGCSSDAISVTALDDMLDPKEFSAVWNFKPASAETRLDEVTDLGSCQHIAVLHADSIAITASRGDGAGRGGLATWSISPRGTSDPSPPKLLRQLPDDAGFEGLQLNDSVLYAVRKPNRLAVYGVGAPSGWLDLIREVELPGAANSWGLHLHDNTLYVTDTGASHPHEDGTLHFHDGGSLTILDVSEPEAPVVQGWVETSGPARSVTHIGNDVVAVASGAAGIDLFDVSAPSHPYRIGGAPTLTSVMSVAYDRGFLLASHWNYVTAYDATEHGALRLLDSTDGQEHRLNGLDRSLKLGISHQFQSTIYVGMDDDMFWVSEFDTLHVGRLRPELSGPRLILHQRLVGITTGTGSAHEAITFHNGGREVVTASLIPSELVETDGQEISLLPGEVGALEFTVHDLREPAELLLKTNDPLMPERFIVLAPNEQGLEVGERAENIELPVVATCDDDTPGCPAIGSCMQFGDGQPLERPVVLAFFSSW